MEQAAEWVCSFKTRLDLYNDLEQKIKENHSYEVPEIVELKTNRFSKAYLSWLNSATSDYPDAIQEGKQKKSGKK